MEHADGQQVQRFVTDSKRSLEPYLNEYGLVIYSNKSTLRRNPVVFYGLNPGCDPDIGHPIRWTIEKSLDHFEDGFKILQETRDSAGSSLNLINDQCWPGPRFEKDSKKGFSRLLKNCVEQAIPVLVRVIFECWAVFRVVFSRCRAPQVVVSAPFRDTTARTYSAGTVAAIRFRMRTRL